ncbi:MAG: hypothetical protein Q9225_001029 [Loekoesia sp. 1 TL-2023]
MDTVSERKVDIGNEEPQEDDNVPETENLVNHTTRHTFEHEGQRVLMPQPSENPKDPLVRCSRSTD